MAAYREMTVLFLWGFLGITPVRTALPGSVFVGHAESKGITHESVVKANVLVPPDRVNLNQSQLPRLF